MLQFDPRYLYLLPRNEEANDRDENNGKGLNILKPHWQCALGHILSSMLSCCRGNPGVRLGIVPPTHAVDLDALMEAARARFISEVGFGVVNPITARRTAGSISIIAIGFHHSRMPQVAT
jgi:hypothetical protein